MKPTRKLTEDEQNRMRDMCASGPLNYKSEIDDELIALHLAEMWDGTEDAVDYTGAPFYAENGTILDCWAKGTIINQGVLAEDADGNLIYREILIEKHNGRFLVILNKDLLKLGMRTVKTLQRGHKGYLSLERLMNRIDDILDSHIPVGMAEQEANCEYIPQVLEGNYEEVDGHD